MSKWTKTKLGITAITNQYSAQGLATSNMHNHSLIPLIMKTLKLKLEALSLLLLQQKPGIATKLQGTMRATGPPRMTSTGLLK